MSEAVMIDIETLGLKLKAPIISIAAYMFDTLEDDLGGLDESRLYYNTISLNSNKDSYRHVDEDALRFWMKAPEDARLAWADTPPDNMSFVLRDLSRFLADKSVDPEKLTVWSHANFDVPILMSAYEDMGWDVPWFYRAPRDIRTIIEAAYGRNLDMEEEIADFPPNPHPHDPRYDAWHQVLMVQQCFRMLSKVNWLP